MTLAALLLFTYGLGAGTLWDQDEPKYFQIARELRWDDPFTLRSEGRPWFVHPPLFFWLQAATARVLGFTEFAARIWSAISGAGMVAATFLIARLLYDGRTGLLAAAIAATTLQVLAQARLAVFDPTLVAFALLAFYMSLVGYTSGSRRAYTWAGAWAGLATATKGPIGLALPAMVMVALWAVRRDWGAWRRIPFSGILAFAAVGLPWYAAQTVRYGAPFVRTAVGYYLFTRFFGVVENQPGPWWYYAPVLVLGALPWTAFAPSAVALLWRRRAGLASQAVLLWCGITVIFYSLAGTKLPNYVLPVYPVLAVGIARLLLDALTSPSGSSRGPMRLAAALLPVPSVFFLIAMAAYGRLKFPTQAVALVAPLTVVAVILAGGPLVAWGFLLSRRTAAAIAMLVIVPVVAVPVLVHDTLPAVEAYRPVPRVGRLLRAEMGPDDELVAVRMPLAASLRFYSDRPVRWVEDRDAVARGLCGRSRVFLVVPAPEVEWVRPLLPRDTQLMIEDVDLRLFRVDRPASCTRAPAPAR